MKEKRQSKIREIIETKDIETQDELLLELTKAGFSTTQATISRDIREMNLTKLPDKSGRQKYATMKKSDFNVIQKYHQVLHAGIISMDYTDNMVVIRTVSGMAMAVAAALDSMEIPGLLGCIAGDDTIFAAVRSQESCGRVIEKIKAVASDD